MTERDPISTPALPGGLPYDASQIQFNPLGIGAVARSVQSRLRDEVHLSDFCVGVGDEAVAIQAAVTASFGKRLLIDIAVSTKTGITGISDIEIVGAGGSIINTNAAVGSDINILSFTGVSHFTVRGVKLVGANKAIGSAQGNGQGGTGILVSNCTEFWLIDNDIQFNTNCGTYITATTGNTTARGTVSRNYFNNNGASAGSTSDFSFDVAIEVSGTGTAKQILVEGNSCFSPNNSGTFCSFYSTSTGTINDIDIVGNQIANKFRHGIVFYGGSTDSQAVTACVASNNVIRDCGWMGIYVNNATRDMVITSNKITNTCTTITDTSLPYACIGAISNLLYTGNTLGDGQGLIVTGNLCSDFSGYAGINIYGYNHSIIANNVVRGDGTAAVNATGTAQGASILLQACTYTEVSGNEIRCTATENAVAALYVRNVSGTNVNYPGNQVIGNRVHLAAGVGIYVLYGKLIDVSHNLCDGHTSSGILFEQINDSVCESNVINATGNGGAAQIRISSPTLRSHVRSNIVISNQNNGNGIWIDGAGATDNVIENNDLSQLAATLAVASLITDAGTRTQLARNKIAAVALDGVFTLAAAATTTVNNANMFTLGNLRFFPTNAAAATLMGSAKCLYNSAIVQGTSFTVATASAAAAAGTETFRYEIL